MVVRCASTASTTTGLGSEVLRSIDVECMMMDESREVALFGVVVASIADLARVFTSFYKLEVGWWKMEEAMAGACAQGAISGVVGEPAMAEDEEQVPVFVYRLC